MKADNGVEPMTLGRILSAAGASRNVVALRSNLTEIGKNPETGEAELRASNEVALVDSVKLDDASAAAIAEISQTKDGALKVKMHSKHAALVTLLRHFSSPLSNRDNAKAGQAANSAEDRWRELLEPTH